nr:MAG TPA: hypothetical protein [Caudoviricetes sp.]
MTPARCMALYREYFKLAAPPRRHFDAAPTEQPAGTSLYEYLMGGG